jgi:hypothetical protein
MTTGRAFTSAICNLKSAILWLPRPCRGFSFATGQGFSVGKSFLALVALAALVSCAAPSPPLPPSLELPTPVIDLKAVRKGNSVLLTWTLPQQTTDGDGIRVLGPTRICRHLIAAQNTTSDSITDCGTLAAELASSQLETTNAKQVANVPQRLSARYTDSLPTDWTLDSTASIAYAIESLNTSRRSAGLSNQARVPAAATEPPPTDFAAQLTDKGVVLTWSGPLLSVAVGDAIPQYFYRVFRFSKEATQPTFVGEIQRGPQDQMRLVDNGFVWEKTYDYRVNITTRIATGPPHACSGETSPIPACRDSVDIEGEDSAPASIVAHDTFPPAVPAALQAVFSGAGQKPFTDLAWNANTDADLAGYNIYRRNTSGPPTRLNTELVKAPAFRDANVVSGQTYFYSVAAVDARGNESARSEEASETVP